MEENKDINLIAIKSLIECIDNRDIAEGGIFLDDDNAEFVADILRYHYKLLTTENKMEAVARFFGKKLGEEFNVKYQISKYKWCIEYHLAFTEKGLTHYGKSKDVILRQLLTGQAVFVDDEE